MLVYEFALTPDVFDYSQVKADPKFDIILIQILRGLFDNSVLADLHGGEWAKSIKERIRRLSPTVQADVVQCLNTLVDRHRIIRYPRWLKIVPTTATDWANVALDSHQRSAFYGIIC